MLVGARAKAVGDLILLQEAGEALDFALIGSGEEDAGVLLHQRVECVDQRWYRSVEALGRARGEVDFREVATVRVENVYCAELVEVAAGEAAEAVFEVPGREVDVFGSDEVADAGAVVALLDLVPPALALIFDHGGLFEEDAGGGAEEVEERLRGSCDGGEELPAGEDRGFAGAGADVGLEFDGLFAAFERCACDACSREAGVDCREKFFGDRRLGEREE